MAKHKWNLKFLVYFVGFGFLLAHSSLFAAPSLVNGIAFFVNDYPVTLMEVYKEQTGDVDAEPQISGGATFARTMNNCVAFGGMLPTTPDYMHQANEQWPLPDMYKAIEIYAQAIKKLCVD